MIIHPKLADSIATSRGEILRQWCEELRLYIKDFPAETQSHISTMLEAYLDEIVSLLQQSRIRIPRIPVMRTALDSVRFEVHVLLLGEEVIASVLLRKINGEMEQVEEWLSMQRGLNRVFHEALRINAASACDHCRWKRREDLARIEALEKNLHMRDKSTIADVNSKTK